MAILFSTPQNIASASNNPLYQDWGPLPAVSQLFYSTAYPGAVSPVVINHKIKDVIGLPEFAQYSAFRYGVSRFNANGVSTNLYNPTSSVGLGFPMTFQALTANGTVLTVSHGFQNLDNAQQSVQSAFLRFEIQGLNASGTWVTIANHQHRFDIIISSQVVTFSPSAININYVQNTSLPTASFNITGNNWKIVGNQNVVLSSSNPDVTVQTLNILGLTYQILTGNVNAEIDIQLTDYFDGGIQSLNTYFGLNIFFGASSLVGTLWVRVNIIESFTVLPEALHFQAVKGIQEPTDQLIEILSMNEYTFTHSPWLIVTPLPEIAGSNQSGVFVRPMSTSNMQAGSFAGFVTFETEIEGDTITRTVDVTYLLEDFVSNDYPEYAFTLDQYYHRFSSVNPNVYFLVFARVKAYEFHTNELKEYSIPLKFPLFNGEAKTSFGEMVHRLMARFSSPNSIGNQYKRAELTLEVSEYSLETQTVIRYFVTEPIKYLAGYSDFVTPFYTFLSPNPSPERVTVNSIKKLHLTGLNGTYIMSKEINGVSDMNIQFVNIQDNVALIDCNFADARQGDVVSYVIYPSDTNLGTIPPKIFKDYYVFPEGENSINIFWESDFLLQEVLEFTGDYDMKSDFEQRNQKLYVNLVEFMKILETKKLSKFTINTGFVMKTDHRLVESLMRSKRAWCTIDNQTIELRPVSKSINNFDSDRDLYDYTVEFEINRNKDAKTYTF